jgi:hypothetical protein
MSQEPRTIATFGTAEEAHMAFNVLQNAGIIAYLEDTNVPGALGLSGSKMCEVNLQVAEEYEARSLEILAQETAIPQDSAMAQTCPKCGAKLPPGFEVCWSCQSPKDSGL